MIPIQCTACGGLSQIDDAWLGREVECPHCHQPTPAIATSSSPPAPPPPPPSAPQPVPPAPPPPPTSEPRGSSPRSEEPTLVVTEAKPKESKVTASPQAPPEPTPKRGPLSRAQREALRRRRHLIFAIGGGLILIITAAILIAINSTPIE